jgi:hypothetical protein
VLLAVASPRFAEDARARRRVLIAPKTMAAEEAPVDRPLGTPTATIAYVAGISANRQVNPGAPEFLIFLPDSPATRPHNLNRIATIFAPSPTNSMGRAVQKYTLVRETQFSNSSYRPLTVSLKI